MMVFRKKQPRLTSKDRTHRRIYIDVTEKECSRINELASEMGVPRSVFLRSAIEGYAGEQIFRQRIPKNQE